MSEGNDSGTKAGTQGGPDTGADSGHQDERTKWTADDWQRETDRRVNEAVKKQREALKTALEAKERDAEKTVAELRASIEAAERKAAFADAALKAGIRDVAGGFAIANSLGYFDGATLKTDELRRNHPGLFAGASQNHGAGDGTNSPAKPMKLGDALRAAAGHQPR